MKKVIYSLSGTGAKTLKIASFIILILGNIGAIAFLTYYLMASEDNYILIGYSLALFLFSLFFFGIGMCIVSIVETNRIRRAILFSELEEKEIEVFYISYFENDSSYATKITK